MVHTRASTLGRKSRTRSVCMNVHECRKAVSFCSFLAACGVCPLGVFAWGYDINSDKILFPKQTHATLGTAPRVPACVHRFHDRFAHSRFGALSASFRRLSPFPTPHSPSRVLRPACLKYSRSCMVVWRVIISRYSSLASTWRELGQVGHASTILRHRSASRPLASGHPLHSKEHVLRT